MVDLPGSTRKRQALGLGLGALIPGAENQRRLFFCPMDEIETAVDQPRTAINPETLTELTESIRQTGVLQPILLRREGNRYRVVAGERRLRAARMAGLDKIPAMVKDIEDDQSFVMALIENVQREDLTAMEEALAYRRLIDEHGYTQQTLADKLGKGRSTIANALRLLELPLPVQEQVAGGRLTPGHARAVLAVPAPEQADFAQKVVEERLSVREAEQQAKPRALTARTREKAPSNGAGATTDERQANLQLVETQLQQSLGMRVVISERQGRGKVEIFYDDDEMLQLLIERLTEGTP